MSDFGQQIFVFKNSLELPSTRQTLKIKFFIQIPYLEQRSSAQRPVAGKV